MDDVAEDPNPEVGWFNSVVTYTGRARIELEDPKVVIEGTFEYLTQPNCQGSLTIRVEKIDDFGSKLPTITLFTHKTGHRPTGAGYVRVALGWPQNPCVSIELDTEDGNLKPLWKLNFYTYTFSVEGDTCHTITFSHDGWIFQTNNTSLQASYWLAPLLNFGDPFRRMGRSDHPLAIMKGPTSELLHFEYNGRPAFIERLRLGSHQDEGVVDAVLVAEMDIGQDATAKDLDWYPDYLLLLLTLGTGNPLSVPWLEFRDAERHLISRIHTAFSKSPGARGVNILRYPERVEQLLVEASKSAGASNDAISVSLVNACRSCSNSVSVEELVRSCAVALEALCLEFGCGRQNLIKECSDPVSETVRKIISEAVKAMNSLIKAHPEDAAVLNTIQGRMSNAAATESSFGWAVAELCQQFGFQDPEVLDAYSKIDTQGKPHGWKFWVTRLRGKTVHRGSFMPHFTGHEAYGLVNHLRDLLVRLLLKHFGYTGEYQPTTAQFPIKGATVDRVVAGKTKVEDLLRLVP